MSSGCYELRDMVLAYGIIPWPRQRACPAAPPATPTGACCLPGAICEIRTQASCIAAGGTYIGDGTACGPGVCIE
jgi:hypothetical protein